MSYNRVVLMGRLTKDPEFKYVGEHPVANFTLAVDRSFSRDGQKPETDFIDIVAWRKLAELATNNLSKGREVLVEGRLQLRSYETQDGGKRKVTEVVIDGLRFVGKRPEELKSGADPEDGEDVPF